MMASCSSLQFSKLLRLSESSAIRRSSPRSGLLVIHQKPRFDCVIHSVSGRSSMRWHFLYPSPLPLHFYSSWCNFL